MAWFRAPPPSKTDLMLYSATINVMVKAARRAGRSLKRDLGEIEHLQVSLKGPANFVTLADKRAEEILYQDLSKARPGYGFIGEEGGTRARAATRATPGSSIPLMAPPTSCTESRNSRSPSGSCARAPSSPA
ncbi:3'-phosphoadenosine 5'-phosphosulfate (PAPS) 3'-phosphatase [Bradyrhizobium sp. USDA 4470]